MLQVLKVRLAHGVGSMAWLVQPLLLTWSCDLLCQLTAHVSVVVIQDRCPKCEVHIWPPQTSIKALRSMPLMPGKQVPLKVAASASPAAYVEEALRSLKEAATFEADVKTASCSIRSPRCLPWPNGSLTFTGASTALRICHRVVVTCDSCKL